MASASGILLPPLSAIYSLVMRARASLYNHQILRTESVGVPVISVGNITTGGTGKTPLVAWISRLLANEGHRVCVLTRGYGRENPKSRVLVSDGISIKSSVRTAGDEPMLLAEILLGQAAVICDADRVSAAKWSIRELGTEVFVLDDGFQHRRISRDLDLLVIDAMSPWGGGRMLPYGRLREPVEEFKRADAIIISRSEDAADIQGLRNSARLLGRGAPVFASRTVTSEVRNMAGESEQTNSSIRKREALAFCGIGNPEAFFRHLSRDGWNVIATKVFPDHFRYSQRDIDELVLAASEKAIGAMLTTSKDAVKLRELRIELPCYIVDVDNVFDDGEELKRMILSAARGTVIRNRVEWLRG
ncbi:MAG: tetraacyldisaccharide 4-kinase [Bryobacterales bacterium]|nr:tetraacyldisaccharide 4-kinase [Bryobacterales bacterium]